MKLYTGGKINTFHGLHPDYISMLEIYSVVGNLGYSGHVTFYYKKPGFSLDKGLVPFNTDEEVRGMLDFLHKNRVAKVYLDHEGESLLQSQVGSSNWSATHQRNPHSQSEVEVCDLSLGTEYNVGPIDVEGGPIDADVGFIETGFGLGELHISSGVGFDIDFGLRYDYGNLNKDIAIGPEHEAMGDSRFDAAYLLDLEEDMVNCLDSDSSGDDAVYYSDHSYIETDDDELYETYIDRDEEFVGIPDGGLKGAKVCEDEILSDGDPKYNSDISYSDDEGNGQTRKYDFKKFRAESDMEDPRFKVGMLFSTPEDFKAAVKQYAIKHQRPIKLVKNDKRRVRATCVKPCEWEVYIAKVLAESTYQVRTYKHVHSCIKTYTNRNVTSTLIAQKYQDDLRANPRLPISAFKERVRKDLKVNVTRNQLYRAKKKAAFLIYGSDIEQYGRLWDYCEELRRSNPGSTIVMDAPVDEEIRQPRFNRLYIFLGSVKSAFVNGCRKIIGVDGCHLKGEYSGQILTAVGVDPNNAMYPMAWAVVEKEDKDTWGWFITLIKMDCNINDNNEHEWTFINDRQKVCKF